MGWQDKYGPVTRDPLHEGRAYPDGQGPGDNPEDCLPPDPTKRVAALVSDTAQRHLEQIREPAKAKVVETTTKAKVKAKTTTR